MLVVSSMTTTHARAQTACDGSRPYVRVELRGDAWTPEQRTRVVSDLSHSLAPQGIDVCSETPTAPPPLAALNIDLSGANKASVEILLQDSVTHKRVARELDLEKIPEDGRDLAVAIEADELLRASWAELALDTERARRTKPQPEVVRSVDQVLAPKRTTSTLAIEARFAAEHFADVDWLGGEAALRLRVAARVAWELAAGGRLSPAQEAPHGSVSALNAGLGTRLLVRVLGDDAASLHIGAGLVSSRVEFRGDAKEGAHAERYTDWLVVARASVLGRLALGRTLGVSAGLSAGDALRGVEVTDAGRVIAAARGIELGATLGLEAR